MFSPPALVPLILSKFPSEHVISQFRLLILLAPCWMEATWLPTVLNMLVGNLIFVCCADGDSLPQSVRQWQGQPECL